MTLRKFLGTALVVVSMAVTGMAQAAPPSPAHPFLGLDVAGPQAPAQATPPDTTQPAAPAQTPAPAQPGKDTTPAQPGVIILDPAILQQLFGGGGHPAVQQAPTPEMLEGVYNRVWKQVAQSYHDPARLKDWHLWQEKYKGKLATEEDLEKALKEMLGSLHDPWTKYISIAEIKKQQDLAKNGISDLGFWIVAQPDGSYKVDYVTYGTPSYASGLHKGDEIKSAGGKDLKGLSLDDAQALLQGKDGTKIEIVYLRNGQEFKETLTAAPAVEAGVVANLLPGNIGYIRLPGFDRPSFQGFLKGLEELHKNANGGLNGLIFDLRGNSGGLVDLALQTASIFMEKGTVVSSTTRDGRMLNHNTYEVIAPQKHDFAGASDEVMTMIKDYYKVPLVVLVDGSSASSSEIVTGALKDSGRATIIGTTTYGKGVGYNNGRIPPGGILFVTTLDYLTPSGYNLSNKGIPPHIVVERAPGSDGTEQVQKALEVLKEKHPDPLVTDPDKQQAPKKQFGDGDLTSNPLVICGALAIILLVIVLFARHNTLEKRRREEEARQNRGDE